MALVAAMKQSRVAQCRVRDFTIALDLSSVRGVERADRLTRVDDLWPQVGSVPSPAGEVPVFSIAGLLGLPEGGAHDGPQLLLFETTSGPVGVQVDQSSQGSVVASSNFLRMPAVVRSQHFSTVLRTDTALLPLLDLDAIFTGRSSRELPAGVSWRHHAPAESRNRLMVIPLSASTAGERAWAVGLPAAAVAELVEAVQVIPVPGVPTFVVGVMSWRGRVIGVLDLCSWLGLQPLAAAQPLVAVVALPDASEPVGLLIPRGVRILKLPIPNLASERAFPGSPGPGVTSVEVGDQTIALIDLARLMNASEL